MSYNKQRESNTKNFFVDQSQRAIALRSKDREFHGLEREFLYCQTQMLIDYNKSKDIKHPRDVGNAREEILRKFLSDSGYLPKRYGISQNSARVASTTGHISKELDVLLFDPLDSVCLMNREGIYEVFPVESVYGVIQVKSRLNKREIKDGLENLASFKRLDRKNYSPSGFIIHDSRIAERGFGMLFAYDSDLEWLDIIHEIEEFAKQNPNRVWCNGIFILSKGFFLHGENNNGKFFNGDIENIKNLTMFGFPDRQDECLYNFYNILINLLRTTSIQSPEINSYFRLPLIAEEHSYDFYFGPFAEIGECEKHGDYQRKIGPDQLTKITNWCHTTEPINWVKATDIAYGKPGDRTEDYARQPCDVRIYNPENLPLSDILVMDKTAGDKIISVLAFDIIRSKGMVIYLPYYYSAKEELINGCPKCKF